MKKLLVAVVTVMTFALLFNQGVPRRPLLFDSALTIPARKPQEQTKIQVYPKFKIPSDLFPQISNTPPTAPPESNQTPPPPPGNPSTNVPQQSLGGAKYMTSEGPLFLSFKPGLTNRIYMFTPMDLSLDGEYRFPLIGSTEQVVGEVKVVVLSGMVTVTYLVANGVKVSEKDEFYTFFPDLHSVRAVSASKLQNVKMKFGIPYNVTSRLNSDSKVLLFVNCAVSYKSSQKGLTPFSFEDPDYIRRVADLVQLMD